MSLKTISAVKMLVNTLKKQKEPLFMTTVFQWTSNSSLNTQIFYIWHITGNCVVNNLSTEKYLKWNPSRLFSPWCLCTHSGRQVALKWPSWRTTTRERLRRITVDSNEGARVLQKFWEGRLTRHAEVRHMEPCSHAPKVRSTEMVFTVSSTHHIAHTQRPGEIRSHWVMLHGHE